MRRMGGIPRPRRAAPAPRASSRGGTPPSRRGPGWRSGGCCGWSEAFCVCFAVCRVRAGASVCHSPSYFIIGRTDGLRTHGSCTKPLKGTNLSSGILSLSLELSARQFLTAANIQMVNKCLLLKCPPGQAVLLLFIRFLSIFCPRCL